MDRDDLMSIEKKRDFREETLLNAAEWNMLKTVAGKYGVSKSAVLRMGLLALGDKITRAEAMQNTGIFPEL